MFSSEEELFACLDGSLNLSGDFHKKQVKFYTDTSQFRVVIGGRRSGKTTVIGAEALEIADQFPGVTVPYIAPTVSRAKDILMPQMRKFEQQGVKLTYNLGDHKIFTPNGGCIQMFGLGTTAEVEKGRGGSYPALYIDEAGAQNQRLLQRAIRETFGPATYDFRGIGGRGITIGGTPDYVHKSYWNDLCGGNTHDSQFKGVSVHHMTIYDNPFYTGREDQVIEDFCNENGLRRDSSETRREWDGIFCIDSDGLAYPAWKGNVVPQYMMPIQPGYTVLGVDFGSDHPCSWVVIRFIITESLVGDQLHYTHHAHVLETYEESGLTIHQVADITRDFQRTYHVNVTYGDCSGKMEIKTMVEVMGIQIQPVVKVGHKQDRIWMMNSMMSTGTMHVYEKSLTLIEQMSTVPIETKPNGLKDHMAGYHDHSLDACHYALLGARQHDIVLPLKSKEEETVTNLIDLSARYPKDPAQIENERRLANRKRR